MLLRHELEDLVRHQVMSTEIVGEIKGCRLLAEKWMVALCAFSCVASPSLVLHGLQLAQISSPGPHFDSDRCKGRL